MLFCWLFPITNEQKTVKTLRCVIFLLEIRRNPQLTLEKDEAELDEEEWRRAKEYWGAIGSRIRGIHPYQGSENKVLRTGFLGGDFLEDSLGGPGLP